MAFELPKAIKPVWDFTIQVIVGAFLFSVVFLVAVGLSALVKWVETWKVAPAWLLAGGHWLEWCLFWIDSVCFGLFLIAETLKLARGIWKEVLHS